MLTRRVSSEMDIMSLINIHELILYSSYFIDRHWLPNEIMTGVRSQSESQQDTSLNKTEVTIDDMKLDETFESMR